jgi:glycosyltransferase involved in cell wall biosynthesis
MKVLHVTYDMRIGGTEMVIKNIIEGNTDPNITMSIFCIESPLGPWGEDLQRKAIAIYSQSRKEGFDFSVIRSLRKIIKASNIDIVHCHQYTPWVYGSFAAMGTSAKIIFTEHGRFYPDSSSWKRRIVNPFLVQLTSEITAISEATKHALAKYEYISKKSIRVIYNGIKALSLSPSTSSEVRLSLNISDNHIVFGTIARLDPIKNHRMMIKAFKKVNLEFPDTKLLIVGDGEERANIESLIEQLSLEKDVILTGYIKNPSYHLECIDVFLLSSFSEGTSMTLLEAMSLSKPCIVTDAGGNREIIKNTENGFVSENDNEFQFSQAMKCLLKSPHLIERLGKSGKRRFDENFGASTMIKNYTQLYKKSLTR